MQYTIFGNALQGAKVLDSGKVLVKVRENRRFKRNDGSVGETHTDYNLWINGGRESYARGVTVGDYVFATGEGEQTVDMYNNQVRVQNNMNFVHRFQYVAHTGKQNVPVEAVDEPEVEKQEGDPAPF